MSEQLTIEAVEQEIIDEFALLDSWGENEKYEFIIDMGKSLPPLADEYKVPENIIKGCQSTVWLAADYQDGRIYFKADSNSVITKGLISMLIRVLSGRTPEEIMDAKLDFINAIGMRNHLAQTRSNGLLAMVKQMKHYGLAFKARNVDKV